MDRWTLFELACLLHGLDPLEVFDESHRAVQNRGGDAADLLNSPAVAAEVFYASPEMYFAPPVGKALQRLKTAAGSRFGLVVNADRAQALAEMLGLPFQPEVWQAMPCTQTKR